MTSYNKRGEKIFYIVVDGFISIVSFLVMLMEKKVSLLFLVIGIVSLLKTIYNIKTLEKL